MTQIDRDVLFVAEAVRGPRATAAELAALARRPLRLTRRGRVMLWLLRAWPALGLALLRAQIGRRLRGRP